MKHSEVAVIGAGGHARSVAALLLDCGFSVTGFYDENAKEGEEILGIKVYPMSQLQVDVSVVLAIGDNNKREEVFQLRKAQIYAQPIIHPRAHVSTGATIQKGTLVFPGAIINALAQVGENCIINTSSVVEHESIIGNHSHVSVGALIAGRVKCGSLCFFGIGSVVSDGLVVGSNIQLGAGAVLVHDVSDAGVYVGVPAKRLRS